MNEDKYLGRKLVLTEVTSAEEIVSGKYLDFNEGTEFIITHEADKDHFALKETKSGKEVFGSKSLIRDGTDFFKIESELEKETRMRV